MKLKVLGSSSAGNCYLIESKGQTLVLEAGVKLIDIKKAVGFDLSRIKGVLITHEHGDHAKSISDVMKAGIETYASYGTFRKTGVSMGAAFQNYLEPGKRTQIGEFTVVPFRAEHDAAEPLGFLISHPESGKILFATDTANMDRYQFNGLSHILIEANYSQDIADQNIMNGSLNAKRHGRVIRSHMSIDDCVEFLNRTDLSETRNIILIHLSDGQSDAREFQNRVTSQTGKQTWVAEPGLTINIAKTPF